MKKSFFHIGQKAKAIAPKSPKANWADERFVYACQNLITCCTGALREGADAIGNEVSTACSQAIVCANVAISCFTYYDEASLAERISACSELAACCELLEGALAEADFDGAKFCLEAAQSCQELCALTAGIEPEEDDGATSADETATVAPAQAKASKAPAKKVSAKRRNPDWLIVEAVAGEDGTESYDMTIDGVIGESLDDDSQVASTEFKNALAKIPAGSAINLYIKSPGGSCLDGYAIYSALQERKDDVTVHVIAALSIASIIALGGGQVLTSLASQWMIHSPLSSTYGNEDDHADSIKMLKSFGSTMADVYSAHTGMSKDDCLAMMKDETWLTGKEAVEMGFAAALDQDADEEEVSATCAKMVAACEQNLEPRYAVAAYYKPTKSISARADAGGKTNAGSAASTTKTEKESIMEKQTTPVAAAPTASPTLEQRFAEERKMRITAEVNRRAEGKVTNSNLDWWIGQALATTTAESEQAIYKQLDDMPKAAAPGGAALRPDKPEAESSSAPVFEVPVAHGALPRASKRLPWMDDVRNLKSRKARIEATKKDWGQKLEYCLQLDARENKGQLPVAANTYSATLITDFLVDQAVTILVARFAALSSFSIEFGPDRIKEYATAQCKFVTSAGTTQRGTKSSPITNFEQGDGTVVPITVPMTHYVKSFNVSQE